MDKNTSGEMFDENVEVREGSTAGMTQDEILQNESDILRNLLELGEETNKPENYHTIKITRGGETKLTFRVRPISEDESRRCLKLATPMTRNKNFKPDTDFVKYRSLLIYTATVDEDRKKIWDNREALFRMNFVEGWQIIDKVIFAGEKARIIDAIEEISGYAYDTEEADETAKN